MLKNLKTACRSYSRCITLPHFRTTSRAFYFRATDLRRSTPRTMYREVRPCTIWPGTATRTEGRRRPPGSGRRGPHRTRRGDARLTPAEHGKHSHRETRLWIDKVCRRQNQGECHFIPVKLIIRGSGTYRSKRCSQPSHIYSHVILHQTYV